MKERNRIRKGERIGKKEMSAKRRGKKSGGTGGPLRTLPVAGYDKRKKRRKNGIMEDGDEGSDDEPLPQYSAEPVRFAKFQPFESV